jgi:hypothetical protein
LAEGFSSVKEQQLPVRREAIDREPSPNQLGANQLPMFRRGNHHQRLAGRYAVGEKIRNRLAQACVVAVELDSVVARVPRQLR